MMGLHIAAALLSLSLMVLALPAWAADPPPEQPTPPSCQMLLDEQWRCAMGAACDKR